MTTTTQFATLGKEELRAACRAAGISYGKLNNDGMRAALQAVATPDVVAVLPTEADVAALVVVVTDTATDTDTDTPFSAAGANAFAAMVAPVAAPAAQTPATVVRDGKVVNPAADGSAADKQYVWDQKCPLCGEDESSQTEANVGVSCVCRECGETYSIKTGRKVHTGFSRANAHKGYTIQKDRAEQNGIKHPSVGTICGDIWAALAELRAATGLAVSADLPGLTTSRGWDRVTVMCQFYAWRKFNGITGRQVRSAVAAPAAETK